jgi:hypothetical protein
MTDVESRIDDPFGVLRRVMRPPEVVVPGERCEMCGEAIADVHSHVANLGERRLLCTCRPCYLLFTHDGAGGQRLRAVPERYRRAADFSLSQERWDDLAIPVDLVFFFEQTQLDVSEAERQIVACYPSPAGATESLLDLGTWTEVAANPALSDVEPDVEAVLVRRHRDATFDCLLVPIDACYELVGIVRQHWVGFQGGAEVWNRIDAFFADLSQRCGSGRPGT